MNAAMTEEYGLAKEYEESFSPDEKMQHLLKLTTDSYTRTFKTIPITQIALPEPMKGGRQKTISGLTASVHDLGLLDPIDVMTVPAESADETYQYSLIAGARRMFAAYRNGADTIDAIVWDFKDKDKANEIQLYLSLLLNRTQKRDWSEIWHYFNILELRTEVTPSTLEYLLQLESGDAMKLKDVMLSGYDEPRSALLANQKTLDGAYNLLKKLRKEEDRLAIEDATGLATSIEGSEELAQKNNNNIVTRTNEEARAMMELDEKPVVDDYESMSNPDADFVDKQKVGERHPLDPGLRQNVLIRDDFTCSCCGMKLKGARLGLAVVHHVIPVHAGGSDTMENLITLDVNCHMSIHIMERNGGTIMMSSEDFDTLSVEEQESLKKCLVYAKQAIQSDKVKGLSPDAVKKYTDSITQQPMPDAYLKENQQAYENNQ